MAAFAWIEPEVIHLEATLKQEAARLERPVLFYGSSSVRLWETLARDLHAPDVLNGGFGGSTLEACVYFFERLVVPVQPRSLVVYAGDNDLGNGCSEFDVYGRFVELMRKVDWYLPEANFTFLSIKPSPARWGLRDRTKRANDMIETYLSGRANARFVDVFQPMLDVVGLPKANLFVEDQLHLSRDGYRLWTELLQAHCEHILNPVTLPSPATR